ncbi:hypothetical protein L914_03746 [Phytophthora nicotianae]|uniref:Uncharacterized protein n=1 Tax=Phytophthora nicotianae TaxID=4792 RepID=W2NYE2_PHYNI|nr:hypothetical protein L914_03746 [Phytophthora nicotianae]
MSAAHNRNLCRFFFVAVVDRYYTCNYSGTQRNSSHQEATPIWRAISRSSNLATLPTTNPTRRRAGSLTTLVFFINQTASNMYQWIEWIVFRSMPLSEIDDPLTRSMSKQKLVCQRLKRYMALLVTAVEAEISADMSGLNGFMFDGFAFSRNLRSSPLCVLA